VGHSSNYLLPPKPLLPVLTSGMEWCAGVVHKLKQTRDNRHLWLTAETTLHQPNQAGLSQSGPLAMTKKFA